MRKCVKWWTRTCEWFNLLEVRTRPDGRPAYKHSPQSNLSRRAWKCLVKTPESALLPRRSAFHQNVTLGRIDSGSYQRSNCSLQEFPQVSLQSLAAVATCEVSCIGVSSFVAEPCEPNLSWQFLVWIKVFSIVQIKLSVCDLGFMALIKMSGVFNAVGLSTWI